MQPAPTVASHELVCRIFLSKFLVLPLLLNHFRVYVHLYRNTEEHVCIILSTYMSYILKSKASLSTLHSASWPSSLSISLYTKTIDLFHLYSIRKGKLLAHLFKLWRSCPSQRPVSISWCNPGPCPGSSFGPSPSLSYSLSSSPS